jgi:drug/metabolite transporter (DMT)-like permease
VSAERRGLAECASSAAAFGSVGVLVALAQHERIGTTTLLASRYVLGAIALWVALIALRHPLPGLRVALAAVALGATTYAAASALYLASIERMGAGPAGVVSYCYPVLVMAGAIMLGRERLSLRRAIGLGLAVTGVVLLVAGQGLGAVNGPGALLAFGSASAYTAYVLASAALRDRAEPLALATLVATGAAGAFAVAHAVHGGAPIHTAAAALVVVALAVIPTAFAVSAFLSGLGRIGPSRASIASSLEPVVAVVCGVFVLGEQLVAAQFVGGALVVVAVLAIELRQLPRVPLPAIPRVRLLPRLVPRFPRPELD